MNKFVDFRLAKTLSQLAASLDVSHDFLKIKIYEDNFSCFSEPEMYKKSPIPFYSEFDETFNTFQKLLIPKKNRKKTLEKRVVWKICDKRYEDFYKKLNYQLDKFAMAIGIGYPSEASYGYIKGKNILENAQQHCGASLILHADIRNFFPSITSDRIKDFFSHIGIDQQVSLFLSKILTLEGVLPLGLHTSPLISNLICLALDRDLAILATNYSCKYTRYADDLTISGKIVPTREEIEAVLQKNNFSLASKKFRITKPGKNHFVTGLSVETNTPRISKWMKRRLRQELYYCNKFGLRSHVKKMSHKISTDGITKTINRIDGTVTYISYFERKFSDRLEILWNHIKHEQNIKPKYPYKNIDKVCLLVDETEFDFDDKKYLCIGIASIMCKDTDILQVKLQDILDKYLMNPYIDIKKEALKKNGLHFSDATEDMKSEFSNMISKENINIYIAYKNLPDPNSYRDTYLLLLHNLLNDRFLATKYKIEKIIIEENLTKIKKSDLSEMIYELRNPYFELLFENKSCTMLSIIDFSLGYFRRYCAKKLDNERYLNFFERIRDKYKIIKNLDSKRIYNRRRPFEGL